jgi:hypothetical protein
MDGNQNMDSIKYNHCGDSTIGSLLHKGTIDYMPC